MKPRIIKSENEKKIERNIKKIKKIIVELRKNGLEIYIAKDVETMFGSLVDNVYVIDRLLNGKIVYQKHLFTVENKKG